MLPYKYTEA